jgi:hypothetical protein
MRFLPVKEENKKDFRQQSVLAEIHRQRRNTGIRG